MNHSFHSADRSTHLKIVIVALVAGIAVAGFGISARTNSDYSQTAHIVKAGKPVVVQTHRACLDGGGDQLGCSCRPLSQISISIKRPPSGWPFVFGDS